MTKKRTFQEATSFPKDNDEFHSDDNFIDNLDDGFSDGDDITQFNKRVQSVLLMKFYLLLTQNFSSTIN